ncbi:MAG: leucine-rich repeat domain-containing protein [Cytophagales bacterium]|nr:leucine-rich repeat domain-containing protein [Cytophagales bacterium]
MKKIFKTPLRTSATLTFILGVIACLTLYLLFLGVYILAVGIILFLIDYGISKITWKKSLIKSIQWTLTSVYAICVFIFFMEWQEHNEVIFPQDYSGQTGIIFGLEGYPELNKTIFWKKKIQIPDSGVILTSTRVEDIPNSIRFKWSDGSSADFQRVKWNPNFEYSTIFSEQVIKAWIFTVDSATELQIQKKAVDLAEKILGNEVTSVYESVNKLVWNDNKGKYLWLQNKNLTGLPEKASELDVYKVILTGNNLTEIPKPILEIDKLEDLYLSQNRLTQIGDEISQLTNLRLLAINGNPIERLPDALAIMPNLETIYIGKTQIDSIEIKRFNTLAPSIELRE